MTRPVSLLPATDPWAAMVARGLISYSLASQYRTGAKAPGRVMLEAMRGLGYEVRVVAYPDGKRFAACARWPERVEVGDAR